MDKTIPLQPAPSAKPEKTRFLVLLIGGCLAACAGWSALVFCSSDWNQARGLDAIFTFYKWRIRWFTAADYELTRNYLSALAGLLGLGFALLLTRPASRRQWALWRGEWRAVLASLAGEVFRLSTRQRWLSGGVLALLTAIRAWMSQPAVTPGYDDVPSYEMFASKSLLAVSAYYPVPNNHVLSNTLSWVCYQLNPGFWFTMRLPVLLTATAATVLLFVGLRKAQASFGVALASVSLFGLAQLSLYHVAVGRGYWLLTLLAGIVFFCTLALSTGTRWGRVAWAGMLMAGILGTYTVPTFALVLASGFSWLGGSYVQQRHWAELRQLVAVAGATALGTLFLYTPLMFVSGPASLFQNGFVEPMTAGAFWRGLPAYWWEAEGFLAGQMRVGAVLTVLGLAGAARGLHQARAGRMPPPRQTVWLRLAPLALWFMLLPYAVLAAQRVYAPGRTLLYKAFFFFFLLSLTVEWLLSSRALRQRRAIGVALAVVALGWGSYQFRALALDNQRPRRRNAALHEAFAWLARQPRAALLVPEPTHSLFVRMYQHSELPAQVWEFDAYPQPGRRYTYVLAFPNQRGQFQPRFAAPPVFQNEQVEIFQAPTLAPAAYWHMVN